MSFVESCANVGTGFGIAVTSQIVVFPWFGIHIPVSDTMAIGAIFTAISIARSYLVRRIFEWVTHG